MLCFSGYSYFLVNGHVIKKTRLYGYKHLNCWKYIIIYINYVYIKYSVFNNNTFDSVSLCKNHIFFSNYFNNKLYFLNRNIDYNVFIVYLKKHDFYRCSLFYHVFLCYIRKRYKRFLFMDLLCKSKGVMFKHVFLNTNKWSGFPCHGSFNRVKSINSFMHFFFKTSANNYFFHKIYISHVFLNI